MTTSIKKIFYCFALLCTLCAIAPAYVQAQTTDEDEELTLSEMLKRDKSRAGKVGADSIPSFLLSEVVITEDAINTAEERALYQKMRRNVMKVYPYATKINALMKQIEDTTATMDKKRKRNQYVNKLEKELKGKFRDELKNLTVSQGKVLIDLVERDSDRTFESILKDYKSGVSVWFYEVIGKRYGYKFDTPYNPDENRMLERVLRDLKDEKLI